MSHFVNLIITYSVEHSIRDIPSRRDPTLPIVFSSATKFASKGSDNLLNEKPAVEIKQKKNS